VPIVLHAKASEVAVENRVSPFTADCRAGVCRAVQKRARSKARCGHGKTQYALDPLDALPTTSSSVASAHRLGMRWSDL
jgi:hypothetical protein